MQKKKPSLEEAIIKARTFCNYRDRCHMELREKLYDMGLWKREVEQVMMQMMEENLLNEERYARSFARGYFSTKQWGRIKIKMALRQKRIHDRLIEQALTEIDEQDYQDTIDRLIAKKWRMLDKGTEKEKRQKVINYLLQKGYEYASIASRIKEELT